MIIPNLNTLEYEQIIYHFKDNFLILFLLENNELKFKEILQKMINEISDNNNKITENDYLKIINVFKKSNINIKTYKKL